MHATTMCDKGKLSFATPPPSIVFFVDAWKGYSIDDIYQQDLRGC